MKSTPNKVTTRMLTEWRAMYSRGATIRAIADSYHVHWNTVQRHLVQAGAELRGRGVKVRAARGECPTCRQRVLWS